MGASKLAKNCSSQMLLSIRNELNLTQQELATRCGISRQQISRIECEGDIPSIETIRKIALGTKISMSQIVERYEQFYYAKPAESRQVAEIIPGFQFKKLKK